MERVHKSLLSRVVSAGEAAGLIESGMTVGFSGFTGIGDPKAVPPAIAKLGRAKNLSVITGGSVGDQLDGELARAGLMAMRYPYQSNKSVRDAINGGVTGYADLHLSRMPRMLGSGGKRLDAAVVECAAVTAEGLIPASTVGIMDSLVYNADKVVVEVNAALPPEFYGLHDIYRAGGRPIPITSPGDRIGAPYIPCPAEKIAAVVLTDDGGRYKEFREPDGVSAAIAEHIIGFLRGEIAAGRQPAGLNPIQSGVGNVANAILAGLGGSGFTGLRMYTEVVQDAAFRLILDGRLACASTTSVSLSGEAYALFRENLGRLAERVVIRPQEISNSPEVIRRLGLVSMNTPIECDIYGNVNSTHLLGTHVVNGIGGSGDFARNAGLSIFATGSTAKGGKISCIVPMVSHADHTEHDVDVIATEHGVADLRWKSPRGRAEAIIENCADPEYRPMLREYFRSACGLGGHTPHDLGRAFSWHVRYAQTGSMR